MAVIGNAPFQGLVSGGEILDASIEGVDLSTSAIAARLGYTPVNPGAAAITAGSINNTTIGATTATTANVTTLVATGQTSLGGTAGAEGLRVTTTASAVNYVSITGSTTGNSPVIASAGAGTDIHLVLSPKGTGNVGIGTTNPEVKLEISGSVSYTWFGTGSITGTTLTFGGVVGAAIGDLIYGSGVHPYTRITAGSGAVWTISVSQTVASTTIYGTPLYGGNLIRIKDTDTAGSIGQPQGSLQFYGSDSSSPGPGVGGYIAAIAEGVTPDTGLAFGTRDNLGGGIDANERMRLTSVGNLGIGTVYPGSRLHVAAPGATTSNFQMISAITTDSAASDLGGGISLGGNYSGTSSYAVFGSITGRKENVTSGNYAGYLQFATGSQALGVREVMRLDSSGNLGLGVTPSAWNTDYRVYQLAGGGSLSNNGGSTFLALSQNAFVNSSSQNTYIATAAATRYRQSAGTHLWDIAASGTAGNAITFTQAMTLDASGNLGIGTTSPKAPLHVVASAGAANDKTLIIQDKTTGNAGEAWLSFKAQESLDDERIKGAIVYANSGSAYGVGNLLFCMNSTADNSNATTANEKMRLTSTGDLGIGTTAPATKLHIFQRSDAGAAPSTPEIRIEHQDINAIGTGGSAGGVLSFVNIQRDNTGWAADRIWGRINFSPSQPTSGVAQLGASILAAADGAIGGQQSASYLAFYTSDFTNGGNTGEKMRISSTGNIGIGTSVTSYGRLTVAAKAVSETLGGYVSYAGGVYGGNGTYKTSRFYHGYWGTAQEVASIGFVATSSSAGSGYGFGDIVFNTGSSGNGDAGSDSTERMRISSGGNVIITGTGILYGKVAGAYGAITDLGSVSPIQGQTIATGTTATRYIPLISHVSVSSDGYAQHTVFGSRRAGAWGEAMIAVGGNDAYPTRGFYFHHNGNFAADGTIYGGAKSFKISHPLPALESTHHLVHTSVESPQADLIYRGVVTLIDGAASVNIDTAAGMTEGTFEALCREVQCFTTNESDWTPVRGKVTGNILNIVSQSDTAVSEISWLVIGERKDKFMLNTGSTDDNGKIIVEPLMEEQDREPMTPENTINP